MAHLERIFADDAVRRGTVLTGQNLADLDENTSLAINGDEGGDYTPANPIVLGGAGVVIASQWIWSGGANVNVTGSPESGIVFEKNTADDGFHYGPAHAGRTQDILTILEEPICRHFEEEVVGATFIRSRKAGARFAFALRVHGNGTIDSITFRFVVGFSHAAVPQKLTEFRVIAVDKEGVVFPLRAPSDSVNSDGFTEYSPRPATGAGWYGAGAVRTFTYFCDQNQTVDLTKYCYFAEIIDESGTGSFAWSEGNSFLSAQVSHSNIDLLANRS